MKRLGIILLGMITLSGCDGSISTVKDSYAPSSKYTFGGIYDDSELCDSVEWDSHEDAAGLMIVELTCEGNLPSGYEMGIMDRRAKTHLSSFKYEREKLDNTVSRLDRDIAELVRRSEQAQNGGYVFNKQEELDGLVASRKATLQIKDDYIDDVDRLEEEYIGAIDHYKSESTPFEYTLQFEVVDEKVEFSKFSLSIEGRKTNGTIQLSTLLGVYHINPTDPRIAGAIYLYVQDSVLAGLDHDYSSKRLNYECSTLGKKIGCYRKDV
jgi:hypothetical protein